MAGNGGRGNNFYVLRRNGMPQQPPPRAWETPYMAPPPAIPPPLRHGWQWNARAPLSASSSSSSSTPQPQPNTSENPQTTLDIMSKLLPQRSNRADEEHPVDDDDDDDSALLEDTDEDNDFLSDDSDESQKSHETRKKTKWFRSFFESLDKLKIEEINEPSRQWHCPACHDGPGAIDWYAGLQPLMAHARTKRAKRVKLHQELAEILDEELQQRGVSAIPSGEVFGKWAGLMETTTDHAIVWPPMVIVMNTWLDKDDNDRWTGMGNQELADYFSSYELVKARSSYGPRGHRGMSVLIFEPSATGYLEAERLHKHFVEQGTDRDAWDRQQVLFRPGGKRQLCGYIARKEDMDLFNRHSQGNSKIKFEMKSYLEKVVGPIKQMNEDNQQLTFLKNKFAKEQRHSKVLKQTVGIMSEKLRKTVEENRIVRQRTKTQHEENKEEMDYQENFFKDQIAIIHETLEEKERAFEKLLQEEREKVKLSGVGPGSIDEKKLRGEEIDNFISKQIKGIQEFEVEREKIIRAHEDTKAELKKKHLQQEVDLEKEFNDALTQLMDKYAPSTS